MAEASFHLEREPWIRVIRTDGVVETVPLRDALLCAHTYAGLAGELPTQDVAVLRLLLAVLHAVFYRVDAEGADAPIEDIDTALDRWEELWQAGRFPAKPIEAYLEKYAARFDLFDAERPFYQVPAAELGTAYTAAKLNGEMSESSNKVRLFPSRAGEEKQRLTYAEAARWLLHVNGFDDTSAKPKGKGLPSVGAGWLGKLGLIIAKGANLFETLMLNLVLLNGDEPWASAIPAWELPQARAGERVEIAQCDDQAQLLTLQSRRILLKREGDFVTGYSLLGGDFFQPANAFSEQMTLWRPQKDNKKNITGYLPGRHRPSKAMWREFSTLTEVNQEHHRPGIVSWTSTLQSAKCLREDCFIRYEIASVQYGDKDFFVKDIFSDTLSFRLNLLSELGASWRVHIGNEVQLCEQVANHVGMLARDLSRAAGGVSDKDGDGESERARETFFFRVDVPFRQWLLTLDAQQNDAEREERTLAWRRELKRIALALGKELVEQAGPGAFTGRTIYKKDEQGSGTFYSAVTAHRSFIKRINNAIGRSETSGKP